MRESLQCEQKQNALTARSAMLGSSIRSVQKFEQWVRALADKAAAITELRRRNHEQLERRVRHFCEAGSSREDLRTVVGVVGGKCEHWVEACTTLYKKVGQQIEKLSKFDNKLENCPSRSFSDQRQAQFLYINPGMVTEMANAPVVLWQDCHSELCRVQIMVQQQVQQLESQMKHLSSQLRYLKNAEEKGQVRHNLCKNDNKESLM
jgi:hypothetical protein